MNENEEICSSWQDIKELSLIEVLDKAILSANDSETTGLKSLPKLLKV